VGGRGVAAVPDTTGGGGGKVDGEGVGEDAEAEGAGGGDAEGAGGGDALASLEGRSGAVAIGVSALADGAAETTARVGPSA
jgi:hypothetical protein